MRLASVFLMEHILHITIDNRVSMELKTRSHDVYTHVSNAKKGTFHLRCTVH